LHSGWPGVTACPAFTATEPAWQWAKKKSRPSAPRCTMYQPAALAWKST
jgi:hypothetical protein